jgi:hypothetical protein
MEKPILSENVTIDDIHKLREFHAQERERLGKETYYHQLNRKVAQFLKIDSKLIQERTYMVNGVPTQR